VEEAPGLPDPGVVGLERSGGGDVGGRFPVVAELGPGPAANGDPVRMRRM
jgi:hypothetical protein